METMIAAALSVFHYDGLPVYLAAAPITHAAGLLVYPHLALCSTIILHQAPEPQAILAAIERQRVTTLFVPPTLLYSLLSQPNVRSFDYSSLRYLVIAGAPISGEKVREAIEVFGPVVAQFFAQSEAPSILTFMAPADYFDATGELIETRLASCGRRTPFSEVEITDAQGRLLPIGSRGEITLRG